MSARRNPPATADGLLHNLSANLERYLTFLHLDLAPVLLEHGRITGEEPRALNLISTGVDSRLWVVRLQTILEWTALADAEEEWLLSQGIERQLPSNRDRGVWSMPSFLRFIGQSKDSGIVHALQQGRKLKRFETEFGSGFSLLIVPILPIFRRLTHDEEARATYLLRAAIHANILDAARKLCLLRSEYQSAYASR